MIPAKILHWLIDTLDPSEVTVKTYIVAIAIVSISLLIGWFLLT
jgi:hypothetical protein